MSFKVEDIKKVSDLLSLNSRTNQVSINFDHAGKLIFRYQNTDFNHVEITLYNEENYMVPKVKEEKNL